MRYELPGPVRALLRRYRARIERLERELEYSRERERELEARLARVTRERDSLREEVERLRRALEGSGMGEEAEASRLRERVRRLEEALSRDLASLEEDLLSYLGETGGWFDLEEASQRLSAPPEAVLRAMRSLASRGALVLVEREE